MNSFLFGLIGKKLSHSRSPELFKVFFSERNLSNCSYELFPLDSIDELRGLLASNTKLMGFNVTIPYKQSIMSYMDELDNSAKEANAVNTVVVERNSTAKVIRLKGYNTDLYGFEKSIKPFLASQHEHALILGTGGAAYAAGSVLKKIGIDFHFVSRSKKNSQTFLYSELTPAHISHFKFIINASPVGMAPLADEFPNIPFEGITADHFLFDMVYNPEQTVFLKKGKQYGAITENGLNMLNLQAQQSLQIWQTEIINSK